METFQGNGNLVVQGSYKERKKEIQSFRQVENKLSVILFCYIVRYDGYNCF